MMLMNEQVIAEVSDRIRHSIEESAENELAEIADLIVIASVHYGSENEGSADISSTFYSSTTGMSYRQFGLLEDCRRAIVSSIRTRNGEES